MYNMNSSPTINSSDVQDGCPTGATCVDVIDLNPTFGRDPDPGTDGVWGTPDDDYGDLHLQDGSPALDNGDNSLLPLDLTDLDSDGDTSEPIPYDLDMLPRVMNGTVDMGAYEGGAHFIFLPFIQ
jgi:hypothetical protein